MTVVEVLLLSVLEGLTEFLPVSSTGHLLLTETALGIEKTAFVKSFTIAIQLGAIAAVLLRHGKRFFVEPAVLTRVAVAFVPTALLGFVFYKIIKEVLLDSPELILWSLGIGGAILILFEWLHGEKPNATEGIAAMPYWQAGVIGVFQALAMVPGVSRSAATVVGGLTLGLKRRTLVEFSFLLAVPTMAAATGYDLLKTAGTFTSDELGLLLLGFAGALVTALLAMELFLQLVKNYTLAGFGWYRIVAALIFWRMLQ
ncbi:MAG: undecaprenyl-diphosphate phosphatase [Gemmataceae bacterium]|nr:undecaprenyl-diphosphate phosphatase [Gemmataceae bacterium]MCI0741257.1 undecaprenyl-diphosphate phosphatase [Gemmataceae bacterium]